MNTWCEVQTRGCKGKAVHQHHRLRRSQGGSDAVENLVSVCVPCHGYIHSHPAWAEHNGWLERVKARRHWAGCTSNVERDGRCELCAVSLPAERAS